MMTQQNPPSRLSRETRQLLTAALIALVALWVLARIRFPDQPASSNPIPSLLSQLSAVPRYANLAGEIADLQARLSAGWLAVPVRAAEDAGQVRTFALPAMRFRPDVAVVLMGRGVRPADPSSALGRDRATGLTLIRVDPSPAGPTVTPWVPPALDSPRYLMATRATPDGVSLAPVLVGSLVEARSPAWPGPVWLSPPGTDLEPGSFAFTTSGEIAGLVIDEPDGPAIVPWDFVSAEAERLLDRPSAVWGDLQIEVQALTPQLARAAGSATGVIVAWIDAGGPASEQLAVGDVIEALNGQPVSSLREWEVAHRRLAAGATTLQVRRGGKPVEIHVVVPPPRDPTPLPLGLTMRAQPGRGTMIVGVAPRSSAAVAGLRADDLITRVGDVQAPTAAQVERAFESTVKGGALLLGIARGQAHLVVGLER
jgi:hypothetical protein